MTVKDLLLCFYCSCWKNKSIETLSRTPICGHLTITPICVSWTSYSKFFPPFAFILSPTVRDLCSISHRSISEIRHWCWLRRSGVQLVFTSSQRCQGSVQDTKVLLLQLGKQSVYGAHFVLENVWTSAVQVNINYHRIQKQSYSIMCFQHCGNGLVKKQVWCDSEVSTNLRPYNVYGALYSTHS